MVTSMALTATSGSPMADPTLYWSIVGVFQYVTLTGPDVAFAVNKAYQYMHAPTENHWMLVKQILRYLKGTQSHGLLIDHHSDLRLQAFSDADWAGCGDDRKSTGGFAIFLGTNLI
ncbi:uncharacterized mitochondrial protein AtMg00810-like [Telopea speciosissima]|uniref:uncharacterized mitochondrial protein AtMg00810-like n=1 Tax=Telopea speciosissima TaxID=54955 RepID=UPI001CC5C4DF|nr:uncharacterized mitochondrial protein AtMg00810-like [Telopea speciosissima]